MKTKNTTIVTLRKREKRKIFLVKILSLLVFFIIWEIAVRAGWTPENALATPSQTIQTIIVKMTDKNPDGATIPQNILTSMKISLSGFFIALCLGVPLGWLAGWYIPFRRFFKPVFEVLRPIPPVALIPLFIVWIGVGFASKVTVIAYSTFIPCFLNAYSGVVQTKQPLLDYAKTCGASSFQRFTKVAIPSSMPMVFSGIRLALGNSWATLVAAEMLAANSGLGYMISMGRQYSRADIVMAGMVLIGLIGFLISTIFEKIEANALKWRKVQ